MRAVRWAGTRALVIALAAFGCGSEPAGVGARDVIKRVVVSGPPVASLGHTVSVGAYAVDAQGNRLDGRPFFLSSDTSIILINQQGNGLAKRVGSVTITAALGGHSGSVTIRVAPILKLTNYLPSMFPQDTMQLAWGITTQLGQPPAMSPVPSFVSRHPTVATVTAAGVVTSIAPGIARLVASYDGSTDSMEVAVLGRQVRSNGATLAGCQSGLCLYGTTTRTVSLQPGRLQHVALSPDGNRLAAVYGESGSLHQLWSSNADGSGARFLLSPVEGRPSWSPDGREIAIEGANGRVMLVMADGSGSRSLTSMPVSSEQHPRFSPDGRRVGFLRSGQVAIASASSVVPEYRISVPGTVWDFDWSPDGRWLAVSTIGIEGTDIVWWAGTWIVRADGSGLRPFSPNCGPGPACGGLSSYQDAAWSPDGNKLLLWKTTYRGPDLSTAPWSYEVRDVKSGALISGSDPAFAGVLYPRWSPDGQRIVWLNTESTFTTLHSSLAAGGGSLVLDTLTAEPPFWSTLPPFWGPLP